MSLYTAKQIAQSIQQALATGGYYTGAIDGEIGPKTQAAIEALKQAVAAGVVISEEASWIEFPDGNHDDPWPPLAGTPAFIHKATQGISFQDPSGASRRKDFTGKWGWYHFTSGEPYRTQAANFLAFIQDAGYNPADLIVLDFEQFSSGPNMTPEDAEAWIQIVEGALGCKVVVYGSDMLADALNYGFFKGRPLWVANYSHQPSQFAIWQYTENGKPYSDMNRITAANLAAWPNLS